MFDPQFLDMMGATASIKKHATDNGYGDPSFGSAVVIPCHVTYAEKIVRSDAQDNETSYAQIQCPPAGYALNGVITPTITSFDRVLLADNVERRVLSVTTYTDETGTAAAQYVMLT